MGDLTLPLKREYFEAIRDLKRNAETLIADALRRAREMAYVADSIRELHIPREGDPS